MRVAYSCCFCLVKHIYILLVKIVDAEAELFKCVTTTQLVVVHALIR